MPTINSMPEVLKDEARRKVVVEDAATLVDEEVKRKKGVSGMLLKSGYAVVKRLEGGRFVQNVVDNLLPEFMDAIEPFHADFRAQPEPARFADFLVAKEGPATQALLSVTDRRSEKTKHGLVKKTYTKLRPSAEEHVKQALPGLGELIDKHTRS